MAFYKPTGTYSWRVCALFMQAINLAINDHAKIHSGNIDARRNLKGIVFPQECPAR